MNLIPKTDIRHVKQQQVKHSKYKTPGPGSYDIALPIIRPSYEAIRKNNDVVILKINHLGQSCNFRSQIQRFPNQKQKSPGPGLYSLDLKDKKLRNKKYSQRYTDLIDFMNRDRIHMSPIPDYKVQYDNQHQKQLLQIKNSHRRFKNNQKTSKQFNYQKQRKAQSICSTSSIIHIKSTSRLALQASERTIQVNKNYGIMDIKRDQDILAEPTVKQIRTIDFPEQSSKMKSINRPLTLQKQQKLLLHRKTLYNRNMLGMLMVKNKTKSRKTSVFSLLDPQKPNSTINFATIDNS